MTLRVPLLILLGVFSTSLHADLTLTGYSTAGPFSTQERISIRESQLRRDYTDRGRAYSQLFDLNKHQLALIDHTARLVELHNLKSLEAEADAGIPSSTFKFRLTPTGTKRPLRHWTCEAHQLTASMPTRLGHEEAIFHLSGTVWIARQAAEQAAIKKWLEMSQKKDFFFGVPAAVKATPAQARMLSNLLRDLAPRGLPCGGELDARYEGSGPLTTLAKRIPARLTLTLHDYSDAPLAADTFQIPSAYTVRR